MIEILPRQPEQDRPRLQAHEDEGQHVEHEDGRFPDRIGTDAQSRRHDRGRQPCDRNRIDDHGDDCREADPLGEDPDAERADELKDRGARRVLHPPHDEEHQAGQHQASHQAADQRQPHHRRRIPEEQGTGGGYDGHPIDQERGRVVEQAFPLQYREDAPWGPELAEHGGGCGRVGRRDDRAERDCRGDRQAGHLPPDDGDRGRGQEDRDERQRRDRHGVAAQVAWRCVEGGVEKHRGHEKRQRKVGLDADRRRERQERQDRAGDRQQRRVRDLQPPRQSGEEDGSEQEQERPFEKGHGNIRRSVRIAERWCASQ